MVHLYQEKRSLDSDQIDLLAQLKAEDAQHDIQFKTLSWQKATVLLFGEYIGLAVLALPWSFAMLGWGVGITVHVVIGLGTWYTSYTLWKYCMKYPDVRDICDVAAHLFPRYPRVAYEATAIMLLLSNIFLIGFHVFTSAKILNTLSDHSVCTVGFQGISAIIGIIFSIPRTLKHVSIMSMVSVGCMFIAILLSLIFAGIESHPRGGYGGDYPTLGPVQTWGGIPPVWTYANGTLTESKLTFVNGVNAFLNITFVWIGQLLYPSFIAEMKEPRDFPKALAVLTVLEMILFLVVSSVGYYYLGQYTEAPMIASLLDVKHRKASFAFVFLPSFLIAAIYGNVTGKYLLTRFLGKDSRHAHSNTVIGWGTWIGADILVWAIAFVLGNVIPSMGDFLSILSAAFDSFFGFLYWSAAYVHLRRGKGFFNTPLQTAESIFNIIVFCIGLFMLGPGLYTSIEAIIKDYTSGDAKVFTCADNGL